MDRWGLRRVILAALALLAVSVALTTQMRSQWQLTLLWGVCVGTGTGVTSMVLAAVVATRWFDARRGLVLGALSAANATGQLVFLPLLAGVVERRGWRSRRARRGRRRGRRLRRSCWCSCAIGRRTSGCCRYGQPATPAPRRRRAAGAARRACARDRARARSGCWPARSSSAARARTGSSART